MDQCGYMDYYLETQEKPTKEKEILIIGAAELWVERDRKVEHSGKDFVLPIPDFVRMRHLRLLVLFLFFYFIFFVVSCVSDEFFGEEVST